MALNINIDVDTSALRSLDLGNRFAQRLELIEKEQGRAAQAKAAEQIKTTRASGQRPAPTGQGSSNASKSASEYRLDRIKPKPAARRSGEEGYPVACFIFAYGSDDDSFGYTIKNRSRSSSVSVNLDPPVYYPSVETSRTITSTSGPYGLLYFAEVIKTTYTGYDIVGPRIKAFPAGKDRCIATVFYSWRTSTVTRTVTYVKNFEYGEYSHSYSYPGEQVYRGMYSPFWPPGVVYNGLTRSYVETVEVMSEGESSSGSDFRAFLIDSSSVTQIPVPQKYADIYSQFSRDPASLEPDFSGFSEKELVRIYPDTEPADVPVGPGAILEGARTETLPVQGSPAWMTGKVRILYGDGEIFEGVPPDGDYVGITYDPSSVDENGFADAYKNYVIGYIPSTVSEHAELYKLTSILGYTEEDEYSEKYTLFVPEFEELGIPFVDGFDGITIGPGSIFNFLNQSIIPPPDQQLTPQEVVSLYFAEVETPTITLVPIENEMGYRWDIVNSLHYQYDSLLEQKYNSGSYKNNRSRLAVTPKALPGEAVHVLWDWGNPSYCKQQLGLLGFNLE